MLEIVHAGRRASWAGLAIAGLLVPGAPSRADAFDSIMETAKQTQVADARSQDRIDRLAADTEDLLGKYRETMRQIDSLRIYNQQLSELIEAQEEEIASLEEEIEAVAVVERELTPLMLRMIDSLEQFVALDVPFLPEERTMRVEHLKELLGRADVTVAEKYRRLLEAYQIENDYGRTIEAYRGDLEVAGETREVNFLRIGRIVLAYQTLDGELSGMWNPETGSFMALDASYRNAIRQGLRIARKQIAPDLVQLPVQAPGPGLRAEVTE